MLINLSNHPSDQWGEKQRACAAVYGEILDMRFPQIDPCASSEDIDKLVGSCYERIMAYGKPAVMLQGEYIFTYRLVTRLKAAGITVLAGCSARRTTEYVNEDGKTIKKSEFEFVGFKEY